MENSSFVVEKMLYKQPDFQAPRLNGKYLSTSSQTRGKMPKKPLTGEKRTEEISAIALKHWDSIEPKLEEYRRAVVTIPGAELLVDVAEASDRPSAFKVGFLRRTIEKLASAEANGTLHDNKEIPNLIVKEIWREEKKLVTPAQNDGKEV